MYPFSCLWLFCWGHGCTGLDLERVSMSTMAEYYVWCSLQRLHLILEALYIQP